MKSIVGAGHFSTRGWFGGRSEWSSGLWDGCVEWQIDWVTNCHMATHPPLKFTRGKVEAISRGLAMIKMYIQWLILVSEHRIVSVKVFFLLKIFIFKFERHVEWSIEEYDCFHLYKLKQIFYACISNVQWCKLDWNSPIIKFSIWLILYCSKII